MDDGRGADGRRARQNEEALSAGTTAGVIALIQGSIVSTGVVFGAKKYSPQFAQWTKSPSVTTCLIIMPAMFLFSLRFEQTMTDYAVRRR
jgi:hypothetical protein